MKTIKISERLEFRPEEAPLFILGPCQIESRDHCLKMAEELSKLMSERGMSFVFKSSFDKANRSTVKGARGVGLEEGLKIFQELKKELGLPVITDIHESSQAAPVAEVVDMLQIPAFLCRQTDLLVAAGKTGKVVNVKKGQFLSPDDCQYIVEKVQAENKDVDVLICDRGSSFGYRDLVVDMRSFWKLREQNILTIIDATHSTQSIGSAQGKSLGNRSLAFPLASAALAAGAHGVFAECHDHPEQALSDAASMLPLSFMGLFIDQMRAAFDLRKSHPFPDPEELNRASI